MRHGMTCLQSFEESIMRSYWFSIKKWLCYVSLFFQNPESDWQKVDYLMEFGEWLFVNEYPVTDALDQVGTR